MYHQYRSYITITISRKGRRPYYSKKRYNSTTRNIGKTVYHLILIAIYVHIIDLLSTI